MAIVRYFRAVPGDLQAKAWHTTFFSCSVQFLDSPKPGGLAAAMMASHAPTHPANDNKNSRTATGIAPGGAKAELSAIRGETPPKPS
eukprot:scaffold243971_cov35-Prasinocladus_malaysianus.AAC.1